MSQVTFVLLYLISGVGEQPMSVPVEPLWNGHAEHVGRVERVVL